jgi:hypothetical protein
MAASDLADWWDKQHEEYKELLGQFVEDHPSWWASGLATLAVIPTELGAGFVDVLRFGEGVAEGGVVGYGKDALRLLALAGPAARLFRVVKGGAAAVVSRVLVDAAPSSGICTWVAAASAVRRTGVNMFASVDDLARAMGMRGPASSLNSLWAEELIPTLRQLGAKVRNLGIPKTWVDVVNAAKNNDGVVMFAIKWKNSAGVQSEHTLYAFKNALGQVRFSDRTGHVVSNMAELEKLVPAWEGIAGATIFTDGASGAMVLIENARLIVPAGSALAALVLPVANLVAMNGDQTNVEIVKNGFEAKKIAAAQATAAKETWTVKAGDWLSRIALDRYKDALLWPILFDANREAIGNNPNVVKVGQKLVIPDIKLFTGPQLAATRSRGRMWRSFNK